MEMEWFCLGEPQPPARCGPRWDPLGLLPLGTGETRQGDPRGVPKLQDAPPTPSGFAGALWLSVGGRGWSVALRLSFGQSESLQRGGTHPEQREAETELLAPGGKHRGRLRNRAGTLGRRGQP